MHAARHGWDLEKDAPLFMRWAIHTGKYQAGIDRPDPKTWKANFRCAMNSLPDIEEVKDKSNKKGTNAFRERRRQTRRGGPREMKSSVEDHVITSEQLPFVCQTIEVTTENEEQTVSSSHSYPLQISPVSSCCGSDTDSDTEDTKEGVSEVWRRGYNPTVLRIPTCPLPGMATFVTATKPNFRVTSTRDPVPLISYHTDGWTPAYSHSSLVSTATGHTHEMRASVIMKTSDVTSS
ncbi:hypothetical protein FQN60_010496 [Etheostoma spectabile]|uniref:IRF tryptophan pentad repeat domain-containing protein n=1 Tax=Etheostoma spectabile TaxID=54343 RepID=A0A5J5DBJ7_9PERO|nr:hypothetical protein FQN60_010496 [Etheostoma spectabile]